jgi:hypothetical protein
VANSLILIGITPFLLWLALLSWIRFIEHGANAGISDAFFLLALGAFAYIFAITIAMPSTLWAQRLLRRSQSPWPRISRVPSVIAALVLICPLVYVAWVYLRVWLH